MLTLRHVAEGVRYGAHSLKRKLFGPRRYAGAAKDICASIVEACWNGRYFRNSAGHYGEFWCRDFGFTVDSLLKLGYRKQVLQTLDYALGRFAAHGRIETTISQSGSPFSFPDIYAPDSLAFLIHALRAAKATELVREHRAFLEHELRRFVREAMDTRTGLIRRRTHLSGMRDYAIRDSSCYDNVMAAFLSAEADWLRLQNPLRRFRLAKNVVKRFWNGSYFLDDLSGATHVTGDANLFPFWTGVVGSRKMLGSVMRALDHAGLTEPFPLRYAPSNVKERMIPIAFLVPHWENDAVWTHIGLLYLHVIKEAAPAAYERHLRSYVRVLERDKTLFELYTPCGRPYASWWYMADEAMLWAANLQVLL